MGATKIDGQQCPSVDWVKTVIRIEDAGSHWRWDASRALGEKAQRRCVLETVAGEDWGAAAAAGVPQEPAPQEPKGFCGRETDTSSPGPETICLF